MSDDKLTCPYCCPVPVVIEYRADHEDTSYGEVPNGSGKHWWRCPICRATGPWRPTRDEAVGTMAMVTRPDPMVAHTPEAPTAWAYEQACKALHHHRSRADAAEDTIRAMAEKDCTRCQFLGRGDPLVDETAAKLAAVIAAGEEMAGLLDGIVGYPRGGNGPDFVGGCRAALAKWREVKG